ncbi:MAG: hypothetical protein Q8S73_00385 [Deltaproteobacteria bacterium]|nr:hypothetical protein [Myxococcales bacterium]MDP3212529.1 hypothetical protein [Deltaproteobacteria bacterium]
MGSDTRREIEQRAKHPGELGQWVEAMIADGDQRLPEVARWATGRGDVGLLMTLMGDYAANSEMRTVEAIREALPTLGDARPPCAREVLAIYIEQAELFAAEAREGESTPEDLEVVEVASASRAERDRVRPLFDEG